MRDTGIAFEAMARDRDAATRTYDVRELTGDPVFDALAALAARICDAPICLVTFFGEDDIRFIGRFGTDGDSVPMDWGLCPHAVGRGEDVVVIPDVSADPEFRDVKAVQDGIRFYAAAPLVSGLGEALGTLCVVGHEPGDIDDKQRFALRTLADQAMANLELRRIAASEAEAIAALEEKNATLTRALEAERVLKMEIDHRVKNSLQLVGSLLQMQVGRTENVEAKRALSAAHSRVRAISSIHGALNRANAMDRVRLSAHAAHLIEELREQAPEGVEIVLEADEVDLPTDRASAFAILMNEFVTNSLKHAFPDGRPGRVTLVVREQDGTVRASFSDDGVGSEALPRHEGLGTRLIQALASQLGATLRHSTDRNGTTLRFEFEAWPRPAGGDGAAD